MYIKPFLDINEELAHTKIIYSSNTAKTGNLGNKSSHNIRRK
jgi:hypothetical protein